MTPREELAVAQEALVAALVANGPLPAGFDAAAVEVAAWALLRKRAREVARAWPWLAASYGSQWPVVYTQWARGRPTRGAWLDGWDFARAHRGPRSAAAALELRPREAEWSYDGKDPRRRHAFAGRAPGGVVVRAFGRTHIFTLRRPDRRTA